MRDALGNGQDKPGQPLEAGGGLERSAGFYLAFWAGLKLTWKVGYPRLGNAITLGNAEPTVIAAKRFSFFGWGRARFVFNIFSKAPLTGSMRDATGVATSDIESQVGFDAEETARLRVLFYEAAKWRVLKRGHATLIIASYVPLADLSRDARGRPAMHGMVDVTGKAGSNFTVAKKEETVQQWTGTFADFVGVVYPSDPPQYGGPGAEGISRLNVDSDANTHRGRHLPSDGNQGFALFAAQPTEFHVDEYAEKVELPANRGQLTFNGQTFSLGPSLPLNIVFDPLKPGRIEISTNDMADVRLDGIANEVYVGDENLTPRRIDGWSWYFQALFGAIIAFCFERLRPLWRHIELFVLRQRMRTLPSTANPR